MFPQEVATGVYGGIAGFTLYLKYFYKQNWLSAFHQTKTKKSESKATIGPRVLVSKLIWRQIVVPDLEQKWIRLLLGHNWAMFPCRSLSLWIPSRHPGTFVCPAFWIIMVSFWQTRIRVVCFRAEGWCQLVLWLITVINCLITSILQQYTLGSCFLFWCHWKPHKILLFLCVSWLFAFFPSVRFQQLLAWPPTRTCKWVLQPSSEFVKAITVTHHQPPADGSWSGSHWRGRCPSYPAQQPSRPFPEPQPTRKALQALWGTSREQQWQSKDATASGTTRRVRHRASSRSSGKPAPTAPAYSSTSSDTLSQTRGQRGPDQSPAAAA